MMMINLKSNICGEGERLLDEPTVLAELGRLVRNLVTRVTWVSSGDRTSQ